MAGSTERVLWIVVFTALVAFAVPWFLWGADAVVAGLPVWVWWHVCWLALAAVAFHLFARRAWGAWTADVPVDGTAGDRNRAESERGGSP